MDSLSVYLDFIKKKGRSLSDINPGSDEIALTVNDALYALNLLQGSKAAVLGGDILTLICDKLSYIVNEWGLEYYFLNWYCDKMENESQDEYIKRSYIMAKEKIKNVNDFANQLNRICYIVIVIQA